VQMILRQVEPGEYIESKLVTTVYDINKRVLESLNSKLGTTSVIF